MRERDYLRKVAQVARANAKIERNARSLRMDRYLQARRMFNAEYKRQRSAGSTNLAYSVATTRFEKLLLTKRGGDIFRLGGDVTGLIKEALL